MISVANLVKTFRVHVKEPGLAGSLRSLVKRNWQVKRALNDVSLEVDAGEMVGLIGANGAGKTTLVKCLAGIVHPTSGSVEVLGYKPWERANDFRRKIALIMGQKAQLWWDLPAADCFLLLREIYQVPRAQFRANMAFLSETLGVGDLLKVQIRRLSLGERMKMELMAALLHSPQVVYLDEPTIGLDITAQRAIRSFLLDYMAEHRPAILLTSHYMEDIESLCRRIIIIGAGEIIYDGSLSEVVRRYARHKVIGVTLGEPWTHDRPEALWHDLFGSPAAHDVSLVKAEATSLGVRVPREAVPEVAGRLLAKLPVADVTIEDEDIASIINTIMNEGRRANP